MDIGTKIPEKSFKELCGPSTAPKCCSGLESLCIRFTYMEEILSEEMWSAFQSFAALPCLVLLSSGPESKYEQEALEFIEKQMKYIHHWVE